MFEAFPEAQPIQGLVGGILIGLSAAIMLIGLGRIAGVSGLTARVAGLTRSGPSRSIATLFVLGLLLGGVGTHVLFNPIEATYPPGAAWLIVGGLVTGFGTRLGSGCTSGHGVCGLSRFSPRSIVATITFIATGIATVAVVNLAGGAWS